jgi:hypothetical protein
VTADERASLGFVDAVREAFGFLLEAGFREISDSPYAVDFESGAVRLRVVHERLSYEINAFFARRSQPEELRSGYSYGQYLKVRDPAAGAEYRAYAATTPDAVRTGVRQLAEDIRTHAGPLLSGDAASYDELAHQDLLAGEQLAARSRRRAYGEPADAAWQAKDWAAVVAAYTPYESDLTASERRRLELARRRVETGDADQG